MLRTIGFGFNSHKTVNRKKIRCWDGGVGSGTINKSVLNCGVVSGMVTYETEFGAERTVPSVEISNISPL